MQISPLGSFYIVLERKWEILILRGNHNPSIRHRDGKYLGTLSEDQINAIDAIYNAGKIEALRHALTGYELDDFQTTLPAIAWISKAFCIGADTGLGKSLMIALYLKIHKSKGTLNTHNKALVVTTTSSLHQIKGVIEKTTGMRVKYLPGDAKQLYKVIQEDDLTKYDIFIVANSVFGKSIEFSRIFSHMSKSVNIFICDESMATANDTTYTHLSIKYWMASCEYRLFLNATIIEKNLKQLYVQMTLLEPLLFPAYSMMEPTYTVYSGGGRGKKKKSMGYKNLHLLIKSIPYHFANVNRSDLGKEFPSVNHLVPLQMTALQMQVQNSNNYNYALFSPTTQKETSIIPFDIFNVPALYSTVDIVKREYEKRGKGIVIYAEPVACKEVLQATLKEHIPGIKVGIIDGETVDKDYTRQSFNRGETHVLIINIPEALDLTAGEVMIMYTMPSKHIQARARIARGLDANSEPKVYYYLVYLNSSQSDYVKNVMLRDEQTTNNALGRGYHVISDLVQEITRLENQTLRTFRR